MASIPDVDLKPPSNEKNDDKTKPPNEQEPQISTAAIETAHDTPSTSQATETTTETTASQLGSSQDEHDRSSGVKACDDTRYRKFFKMVQFGVPAPAVKLKMANDGFDPNVLE